MKLKNVINVILIAVLSISSWEIGQKQWEYYKAKKTYEYVQNEKTRSIDTSDYLKEHGYDWITVEGTVIDYPVMAYTDNIFYINHDYQGNESDSGAIFYCSSDEPFDGKYTMLYGHSMKNGTMFNNLHYFQKDHQRFKESILTIETAENIKTFKPFAYYVTNNNFFYKQIDNMETTDAVTLIKQNSDYFINGVEYNDNSHIVALYTCDYSIKNGRLIVFYISE
jgi:sortase B